MEKKKYLLRSHFVLDLGDNILVGPCEVELDDKKAALEAHKLEPIKVPQKKKL